MPAKPVSIGPLSFSSKGHANDYFKDLLYKYDLGDKVTDEGNRPIGTALPTCMEYRLC